MRKDELISCLCLAAFEHFPLFERPFQTGLPIIYTFPQGQQYEGKTDYIPWSAIGKIVSKKMNKAFCRSRKTSSLQYGNEYQL